MGEVPAFESAASSTEICRCCGAPLTETFADLGMSPLANSYVPLAEAGAMERFYPLRSFVCKNCYLVQLGQYESPETIFADYLYFSSFSETWLRHAEEYVEQAIRRFHLNGETQVTEVASNDGYLLQYFKRRGIPVFGIDPAPTVADAAIKKGIPTEIAFFNAATARRLRAEGLRPALIVANNVMAHVPNLHDFVQGFRELLAPDGVITIEFPHLLRLMAENQFDTIYHEHFSYFSLLSAERVLGQHGLEVFDVEELPTHGGSLRIYVRHAEDGEKPISEATRTLRSQEIAAGLAETDAYRRFGERVVQTKLALLDFLIDAKRSEKRVVGYGAPAKGNTLLNYCGVGPELLEYTVDLSPHKQGHLLPGTRIPILAPEVILKDKPDFVLILPWNLKDEISKQMAAVRGWGGKFVVPIPTAKIF